MSTQARPDPKAPCPCHSGALYERCCQPFIDDILKPQTPLQLMRSRYCAYTLNAIDYLLKSACNVADTASERHNIAHFANAAYFQHLEILDHGEDFVEFKAYYILDHHQELLHERSRFTCNNGIWCYESGTLYESTAQIKRNDACICQSGKKYKKCCALR